MTETNIELQMSEETPEIELQKLKEVLKNKQKIRLHFPYSENAEVKKHGAKYDNVNKYWYFPSINSNVPEELKQYIAHKIFVEYDDIMFYKPVFTSMKFDKLEKVWYVNQADYKKFLKMGGG